MQDTDKVSTSLLNVMPYSNIDTSLKTCEQEIAQNNNSHNNNSKNTFHLLSHLVLHKSITVEENWGIT